MPLRLNLTPVKTLYLVTAIVVIIVAIVNSILFTTLFPEWIWWFIGMPLVYMQQLIAGIILLVSIFVFAYMKKLKYLDIIQAAVFGVLMIFMWFAIINLNIIVELAILADILLVVTAIAAVWMIVQLYG